MLAYEWKQVENTSFSESSDKLILFSLVDRAANPKLTRLRSFSISTRAVLGIDDGLLRNFLGAFGGGWLGIGSM